jgi:hypothetical protein
MFTILIDIATVLVCALAVSGCGQEQAQVVPAPQPDAPIASASANAPVVADPATAVATPTATPTPNPTNAFYAYFDLGICTAFDNWDPAQTTIITPTGSATNYQYVWVFRYDGVFEATADLSQMWPVANLAVPSFTIDRSNIYATVCTIMVINGQYAGVTP